MAKQKRKPRRRSQKIPPLLSKAFIEKVHGPVPIDVWRACLDLYTSARAFKTPVTNPEEYQVAVGDQVVSFTDTPMNRGLVAVKEFLRGTHEQFFPGVFARLLAVGETIERVRKQDRFAKFFLPDTDDGQWMVGEALIEALASAPFDGKTGKLDLDTLHTIASEILATED